MERWKDTLFLCIFFSAVYRVSSNSCEESSYERCLKALEEFSKKPDFLFGNNEEELQSECITAQSKLDCLYRYTRRCLSPEKRDDFIQRNIAQPEELIETLCSEESKLRQEYLQIVPCLRNTSEGLLYCRQKYDYNERDINISQYENEHQLRCCSFNGYRNCLKLRMELNEDCEAQTIQYVDEITLAMVGTTFLEKCEDEFEWCTSSETEITRPFLSIIVLMFTIASLRPQLTLPF